MRFKPLNKDEVKIGDLLMKYYTQKEWAIMKVVDSEGEGARKSFKWEAIVISDMTQEGWRNETKYHPDMQWFDITSRSFEGGEINKISKNMSDPGIKEMCHQAIKKVLSNTY